MEFKSAKQIFLQGIESFQQHRLYLISLRGLLWFSNSNPIFLRQIPGNPHSRRLIATLLDQERSDRYCRYAPKRSAPLNRSTHPLIHPPMFPVRSFYLLAILFYFGTTIILRLGASDRNPLPILGAAILVAMSVIYFITIAPKLRPLLRLNLFQSLFVFSVLFNAYFFIDLFYGHYTAADSGELHGRKLRCFVIYSCK